MRVARHLLIRFIGLLAILVGLAAAVLIAVEPLLAAARARPSPWSLAPLLAWLAAAWTAHRTARLGELVAIASTGRSRFGLAVPCVVAAAALELLACAPSGARAPEPVVEPTAAVVQLGIGGALWLRPPDPARTGAWWPADAEWPIPSSLAPPEGFVPEPRNPRRLRRQLFLIHSPLHPPSHPLDPTPHRWAWLLFGCLAVWWTLGTERARARPLPLLALPVLVVLL